MEKLLAGFRKSLKPPPKLTVSTWADAERRLSPESSAEPGRWRTSRAPYQRGMMDAVNDIGTNTVVIMSSAQVGKTELLNNVVAFYIDHEPCPILILQPTLEMAQTWSKDRLAPMLRDTPALANKVKDPRSRDSQNRVLQKHFPGGHITMAGANSPASLASRPIRVVLCDEVDRYPASAGSEGDPVSLAKKRTNTFWNRKLILTSTPTVKGSRIEAAFKETDQRYYEVPCPHCGEYQVLKWANVVFDKEDLSKTAYACDHNGCVIEESSKPKMMSQGKWVATQPFNGKAGFHISELYSPWKAWADVAADFLEAKGDPERMKTWTNTSLGEVFTPKLAVKHERLAQRIEAYDADALTSDILFITAGVDIQNDRIEALSQGWGVDYEHWDIEHKIFWGDPAQRDVWEQLDEWLLRTYQCGPYAMKVACCAIDSGFRTDHVYKFCKPRQGRRIFAVKGSSNYSAPIVSKPTQSGKSRTMLYTVGADTAKDTILTSWLNIEEYGPGYIHLPNTVDEEYLRQLTAEYPALERGRRIWKKARDRNEILDLHVYNYAAYHILNPNIPKLIDKRNVTRAPAQKETSPPPSTRRRRPIRQAINWATDI